MQDLDLDDLGGFVRWTPNGAPGVEERGSKTMNATRRKMQFDVSFHLIALFLIHFASFKQVLQKAFKLKHMLEL